MSHSYVFTPNGFRIPLGILYLTLRHKFPTDLVSLVITLESPRGIFYLFLSRYVIYMNEINVYNIKLFISYNIICTCTVGKGRRARMGVKIFLVYFFCNL